MPALLMPKGVPGCVVPSMVVLAGRLGSVEARVMVRPARDWSAILKTIRLGPAPLAAAWLIASRREPGPLSAFVVTVKVVAKADREQMKRSRVRANFMERTR